MSFNRDEPRPSTSRENVEETENENALILEDLWNKLREILPDADPDFLFDKVEENKRNLEKLQEITSALLESRDYPKLKDTLKRQEKEIIKNKYLGRNVSIEEFLDLADDPIEYFYNKNRPKNENYKTHVKIQLCNDFPHIQEGVIQQVMENFNYSLTNCYRELQNNFNHEEPLCKRMKYQGLQVFINGKKNIRPQKLLPDEPDELFYKELAFLQAESVIKEYISNKKKIQQAKVMEAQKRGELVTCCCCYDDEFLIEDVLLCDNGHMFCKSCIRRSTEENIGQSKYKFPCLAPDCNSELPLSILQQALRPVIFSNLIKKMQEAEIQEAAIPDLISCPFCSFCAIVPDPNDKVFKCMNPDCKKESCRFCKELNHVPLSCEEVEKSYEVNMRTYIENRMTEALLRTCPTCNKKFIKTQGCNKMTCVCGTQMCYVCRQIIKGYDHFNNGRCPQISTDDELHDKVVKKEAEEAKKKYLSEHPELKNTQLKYDPTKNLSDHNNEPPRTFLADLSTDEDSSDSNDESNDASDFTPFSDDWDHLPNEDPGFNFNCFGSNTSGSRSEDLSPEELNTFDSDSESANRVIKVYSSSSESWPSSVETLSSFSSSSSTSSSSSSSEKVYTVSDSSTELDGEMF